MPVTHRETVPQKRVVHVRPSLNGSVLSEAVPIDQIQDDWVKFVLYGYNRTGKTTLACEFEKPLLLISFEMGVSGGAKSVKRVPGVKYLRITKTEKALALAKEIKDGGLCDLPGFEGQRYATHVLDTVTSMQDIILKEIKGYDDVIVQQNWGMVAKEEYQQRSERCKEILRAYRDCQAHTIFLAQEKDHNPQQDMKPLTRGLQLESFFASDLGGATVKWLHDACDYIGRLYVAKETKTVEGPPVKVNNVMRPGQKREVETGRQVRRLRTMYHVNYAAGFRSSTPAAVPEYIEAVTPSQMHNKIIKVINGEMIEGAAYLSTT